MTGNDLLQVWWLVAAMLVFMMQVGFLLLETGLIQERHQAGIAVKSMMMLLASSTAYTIVGHHWVWKNSMPPLDTAEWQFYQTGFAAVAAAILSGAMAGRTTLVSNVLMAALVGAVFYPAHAQLVWGGGFLSTGAFRVHDFAGSGCVHVLGGLIALAGAAAAGPRSEKRDLGPNERLLMHIPPRSLPVAACGVLFLWIGWMGFNGGSIQQAGHLATVGRLVISTCLAASAGGLAVTMVAGLTRLLRREGFIYAPYATLSGIMAGMVANSASCDLIAASHLYKSLIVGAVAGVFAYAANYMVQQIFRVDDPIEAVGVHAGGGVVGLVFAGLYQSPSNVTPQLVDIAVLVSIILVPAYVIFKLMDLCGQVRIFGRKPIRLKSTPNEENLGLTFDDPSSRVGIPVAHFHYLPDDLRRELTDHVNILTSMPAHLARSLYNDASDLIEAIRESIYSDTSNAVEAIKQSVDRERQTEMQLNRLLDLQEGLRQRIDNIPMVLNRLNTGKGEQVNLESIVEEVLGEYQKRYPEVKIKSSTKGDATPVNGDANLTKEAVRMLLSNSVRACTRRLDRGSRTGDDPYEARVEVSIDWNPADGGEQVLLKIEDNGVGITPEVRRQLGHPLSASSTGRGYGLGLFFANLIAQRFGGTLSCPPQKDSPTTLFVMGFQRWKL